jgi:hypothetical protein
MSGNGQVTNFPPTTQQNQICWVGVPNDSDLVMFFNTDLNNYAYVGYTHNLVVGVNTIPIAPNASINLPANRTIYAIWSTTVGVLPLVVIPGGASYFLGLTQGLGNLAIPSVQSPNFITGLIGWIIRQNGNAEFNNLTIRGTFFGLDFIINSAGAFFYSGTPALGNLKISIASAAGTDNFGNVYTDNIACYNIAVAGGGYTQIAANPVTGLPYLVQLPPGIVHLGAAPQVNSSPVNAGLVTERAQINVSSGYESGTGATGAAVLQLASRANNSAFASLANLIADQSQATKQDTNVYPIGEQTLQATATPTLPQTINVTSATVIAGCGPVTVIPGTYTFEIELQFQGNQAAGTANFQIGLGSGAAATIQWGNFRFHDAVAGTSGYVARPSGMTPFGSPTLSVNNWMVHGKAQATFTAGGAISLQAFCSVAADTFKILNGYLKVRPNF